MPDIFQWAVCAALGLWAAATLLDKFGLWPQALQFRKAGGKPGGGACGSGGCAHCDAARAVPPDPAAVSKE